MDNITNYERIRNMSLEDLAEKATMKMLKNIRNDCWMSMIDWTFYSSKEETVKHNIRWLNSEVDDG